MPWKPSDPHWQRGGLFLWPWHARSIAGGTSGVPAADARKLQYALEACDVADPFVSAEQLDPAVIEVGCREPLYVAMLAWAAAPGVPVPHATHTHTHQHSTHVPCVGASRYVVAGRAMAGQQDAK